MNKRKVCGQACEHSIKRLYYTQALPCGTRLSSRGVCLYWSGLLEVQDTVLACLSSDSLVLSPSAASAMWSSFPMAYTNALLSH